MPKARKPASPLTTVPDPEPYPHEFMAVAAEARTLLAENRQILEEIRAAQPAHMEGTANVAAMLSEIHDVMVEIRDLDVLRNAMAEHLVESVGQIAEWTERQVRRRAG